MGRKGKKKHAWQGGSESKSAGVGRHRGAWNVTAGFSWEESSERGR